MLVVCLSLIVFVASCDGVLKLLQNCIFLFYCIFSIYFFTYYIIFTTHNSASCSTAQNLYSAEYQSFSLECIFYITIHLLFIYNLILLSTLFLSIYIIYFFFRIFIGLVSKYASVSFCFFRVH